LFCLVPFFSVAAANFLRFRARELEVAAPQILEFADEVFCGAEAPIDHHWLVLDRPPTEILDDTQEYRESKLERASPD
jgi:hypothetical protein